MRNWGLFSVFLNDSDSESPLVVSSPSSLLKILSNARHHSIFYNSSIASKRCCFTRNVADLAENAK